MPSCTNTILIFSFLVSISSCIRKEPSGDITCNCPVEQLIFEEIVKDSSIHNQNRQFNSSGALKVSELDNNLIKRFVHPEGELAISYNREKKIESITTTIKHFKNDFSSNYREKFYSAQTIFCGKYIEICNNEYLNDSTKNIKIQEAFQNFERTLFEKKDSISVPTQPEKWNNKKKDRKSESHLNSELKKESIKIILQLAARDTEIEQITLDNEVVNFEDISTRKIIKVPEMDAMYEITLINREGKLCKFNSGIIKENLQIIPVICKFE